MLSSVRAPLDPSRRVHPPMNERPRPNEEQVDIFGRLFARILDKRDGTGTQEAVDEVIEEFIAYKRPSVTDKEET